MNKRIFEGFGFLMVAIRCSCGEGQLFEKPKENYQNADLIVEGQTVEEDFSTATTTTPTVPSRFYAVKLDNACVLNIALNGGGKFRMRLQDGSLNNTDVLVSLCSAVGQDYQFNVGPFAAGQHYIVVESDQSAGNAYKFTVTYDCSDTGEPNNSFPNATPIANGEEAEGKILALNNWNEFEDRDFFYFDMDRWGIVWVNFNAPGDAWPVNARIRCTVYQTANDQSALEYVDVVSGQSSGIWVGPLNPGRHFIVLNQDGGCNCESTSKYKLRLQYDFGDKNEPNYSPTENATDMAIDTIYKGMIAYPAWNGAQDDDWFKFIPKQSGRYRIELIGLPYNNTYCFVYLTPPNGNNYTTYFETSPSGTNAYENNLDAGRTYWFRINQYAYYESDKTYSLRMVKK